MYAINSYTSFHHVKTLSASTQDYPNAPLMIALQNDAQSALPTELVVFLSDDILTKRLITAINEVCEARRKELQPVAVLAAEQYGALVEAENAA